MTTCTRNAKCIVGRGKRHYDDCPRHLGTNKGGEHRTHRTFVATPVLEALRIALSLPEETNANDVLLEATTRVQKST